ncbi:2-amino-4-hydroxy-6-hydroxymethyldihydropteridine diphosphokinase [Deinococcus gobiensis]|uniref:2-amino-4-hydroxy-6- hydroxymethyldihydropteridine diphosphokinase n=1 Tax=Deinococcus gobiensis TaxID=502394 RepID=UPI0002F4F7FD|nr:2-amino-4-hydroxy-6-hydroxymethyldihydropteridine diphosphokinase [Deinococcus gobiensis]
MSHSAFIALGANLGEPLAALRRAVDELRTLGTVEAVSALYRTAPVGGPPGQPDYLNAALRLDTDLTAAALLAALHAAEARAGRERSRRWEARVLDLDLILYGDQVSGDPALTLPHPRAWERAFVLAPLADLDPALPHPVTGETAAQALARVGPGGIEQVSPTWTQ